MKPSVYIETSIVSYLTARPSKRLLDAAQQKATRLWWQGRAADFELVVSEPVWREASRGDTAAARRRTEVLSGLRMLELTDGAAELAAWLLAAARLPRGAALDALHVALAAVHGVPYLLTWNCTHIANGIIRPRLESGCRERGFQPPTICTPYELM